MTAATEVFGAALSDAFCNKQALRQEGGTWENEQLTIEELFAELRKGKAHTCPLALNLTYSPAWNGEPDPSLGPAMRDMTGSSERLNSNALPTRLMVFDLDGDTTLEAFLECPFAKEKALAVAVSARHCLVQVNGKPEHRLRVFVLADEPVPLYFDDPQYSDPYWLLKEVRAEVKRQLCQSLGIERLKDNSGDDAARIFYGNTGPSNPVGDGDERPAAEVFQKIFGNRLPDGFVQQIHGLHCHAHQRDADSQDIENLPVGTPRQLADAEHILGSGILSNQRAAEYQDWLRLLMAVKKLDPTGDTLLPPFLKFSNQSPQHDLDMCELQQQFDQLPDASEIFIGITAIREAASEDCDGWESNRPSVGGSYSSQSKGTPLLETGTCAGPMLSYIRKRYEALGEEMPEVSEFLPYLNQEAEVTDALPVRRIKASSVHSIATRRRQSRAAPSVQPSTAPTSAGDFNGYDLDITPSTSNDLSEDF